MIGQLDTSKCDASGGLEVHAYFRQHSCATGLALPYNSDAAVRT